MIEMCEDFFLILRFAKNMYDCRMDKQFKKLFGFYELNGDSYWELAYETISWVFQDTRLYYNDEKEIETWLFIDPVIDRFCELCQQYERQKGISETDNHYQKDMAKIAHNGFNFNSCSYAYSWRLSAEDRGRKCLLLFTDCEFCCYDEISNGLMVIKDGFEMINQKLEREMNQETRIMPLSLVTAAQWKEAA